MDHRSKRETSPSREDARIARSRAALRRAMIALVGERPFEDITVAQLTERAGVGYATFFRRYPDKEALLVEVADEVITGITLRLAPLVMAGDNRAAAAALVARIEEDRALFRALLIGGGAVLRRTMIDRAIAVSLAVPADESAWLPRDLAVRHMVAATLTVLTWWLEEDRGRTPEEVAVLLQRLVIDPAG